MPIHKVCEVCGKNYSVPPVRANSAKTCSISCRAVLAGVVHALKRVKTTCKYCSAPIEVSVGRAARGNGIYCSKACNHKAMSGVPFTALATEGTKTVHSNGYVFERVRHHPFSNRGRVFQHRLVMESILRVQHPDHPFLTKVEGVLYLKPEIAVHHKNEIKDDNRPENLMACTNAAHRDIHEHRIPMQGQVWPEQGNEIQLSLRVVECECQLCRATFRKKLSEVKRGSGKFCSKACFYEAKKLEGRPQSVKRHCLTCGAEFLANQATIKKGGAKFCSTVCYHKAKIGKSPSHIVAYD